MNSFENWIRSNSFTVTKEQQDLLDKEIIKYDHLSEYEFCKALYDDIMNNPNYPASFKEQINKSDPKELMDLAIKVRKSIKR